jgi:hypothetical protein
MIAEREACPNHPIEAARDLKAESFIESGLDNFEETV